MLLLAIYASFADADFFRLYADFDAAPIDLMLFTALPFAHIIY